MFTNRKLAPQPIDSAIHWCTAEAAAAARNIKSYYTIVSVKLIELKIKRVPTAVINVVHSLIELEFNLYVGDEVIYCTLVLLLLLL